MPDHDHRTRPATNPKAPRSCAAEVKCRGSAAFFDGVDEETTDALGEAVEPEPPAAVVEVAVVFEAVARALAWNSWKVLLAVGLMAKTMPCAQCLNKH